MTQKNQYRKIVFSYLFTTVNCRNFPDSEASVWAGFLGRWTRPAGIGIADFQHNRSFISRWVRVGQIGHNVTIHSGLAGGLCEFLIFIKFAMYKIKLYLTRKNPEFEANRLIFVKVLLYVKLCGFDLSDGILKVLFNRKNRKRVAESK